VRKVPSESRTVGVDEASETLTYSPTAGIGNAIFTFVAFASTLPALATNSRSWLKVAVVLIVIDALFTLIIGLDLWILTLRIKDTFSHLWVAQPVEVQSFMQTAVSKCRMTFDARGASSDPFFVSSIAAVTSTALLQPSIRIPPVLAQLQRL
jgi:hypothetical protein